MDHRRHGGRTPPAAHAAGRAAPVGTIGTQDRARDQGNCYTVRPDLGGYIQRNIHYPGGRYAGWVQIYLLYCPVAQINVALVTVHVRSGSIDGQAQVFNTDGAAAAEPPASFGIYHDGDQVITPGIYSPVAVAQACWYDVGERICTAAL